MKILIGLGNPEKKYENTRHNAGFRVLDELATRAGAEYKTSKDFQAATAKTMLQGREVLLVKPLTYMNLSGQAVAAIVNWFKIPLTELLVIHDEVSLPLGKIRMQSNAGPGGQHGVMSIISSLGGKKEFDRIRVGVGPDPGGDRRADYVLSSVAPIDADLYEKCVARAADAAMTWLDKGLLTTMNQYNGEVIGIPDCLKLEEELKRKKEEEKKLLAEKKKLEAQEKRAGELSTQASDQNNQGETSNESASNKSC